MNEFLTSVREDLLDRRIRPFLALAVVALLAALGYALLGGGGSSPASPAGTGPQVGLPGSSGLQVSSAAGNSNDAVAEITSGAAKQRRGAARNPFAPLPGAKAASNSSATSKSKGSSSSGGASGTSESSKTTSSGSESGGAQPVSPKQSTPAKPRPAYNVSVLFGQAAPGTPPASAQLTPYSNLRFQQKLPSPQQRLLSFAGASSSGKTAQFKLVAELIPRGPGECKPSPTQCEAIALQSGQTEELEYLPPAGAPVTYELQVTITAATP
jgi:hypothetical protein